ncbi:D-amino-acid transaminase [Alteribacillus sp. YIM 98480]|uniref:D-amino-acid transaminase n=1 Tax=Alteribacillus sp. YIM 98480 TaxID=2606599 RepID=UPI00131D07C4|nr:D-amino-acid transaminase [Alteribacillus sp. YIM 98480]
MEYVWLKDKIISRHDAYVHFDDRGYYFGDGIYEVIRVYEGVPFLFDEHFERFLRSAKELDMPLPYSITKLKENTRFLLQKNDIKNGYVYIQMTRGEQARDHLYSRDIQPVITAFTKEAEVPVTKQKNGVSLLSTEDIRWLRCDIKTINLLGNVMAKRKAEDNDCDEALQHRGDIVTEGSSTNIFFVKKGVIYTHPANNHILNGITRQYVFNLAQEEKIPIFEEAFPLEETINADEIFVTSTTLEIAPVINVKGSIETSLQPGTITRKLQQAFKEHTNAG